MKRLMALFKKNMYLFFFGTPVYIELDMGFPSLFHRVYHPGAAAIGRERRQTMEPKAPFRNRISMWKYREFDIFRVCVYIWAKCSLVGGFNPFEKY